MTDRSAAIPVLEVANLRVRPSDNPEIPLLMDSVSFSLNQGDVVDLVGPSGSGKSSLLAVLAMMHPYGSAKMLLKGNDSATMSPASWRMQVALVLQQPAFLPGTVRSNMLAPYQLKVRSGYTEPTDAEIRSALDSVGLDGIELDRDITKLSGGQRARVSLLRTVLTQPSVLLLDEVDAALDDESARLVGELVATYAREVPGRAVLRIRHRTSGSFRTRHFHLEGGKLDQEISS